MVFLTTENKQLKLKLNISHTDPVKKAIHTGCSVIAGLALILVVLVVFQYAQVFYVQKVTDSAVQIEIVSGETFAQISRQLDEQGLLPSLQHWRLHTKFHAQEGKIQAGEYQISSRDTMASVLNKLVSGDMVFYKLTILAGWNLSQILKDMEQALAMQIQTLDTAEIAEFLQTQHPSLEGWFYPDTYLYHRSTSNLELLSQAYKRMQKELLFAWDKRADDLILKSPYEALILASIIEKETILEDERSRIAGVFISRLMKNMKLQTDPTVIYGIGPSFDGNIRQRDLSTDTPYNTYIHRGLPPTPIAMPQAASIAAAVNPDITGDLYFVSKGDGSHYFSKTYAEHQTAVSKYQLPSKS